GGRGRTSYWWLWGLVQQKVPGWGWASFHPALCLARRWWRAQSGPRLRMVVLPLRLTGTVWSRWHLVAGRLQPGNTQAGLVASIQRRWVVVGRRRVVPTQIGRSEEHTSELQSRE